MKSRNKQTVYRLQKRYILEFIDNGAAHQLASPGTRLAFTMLKLKCTFLNIMFSFLTLKGKKLQGLGPLCIAIVWGTAGRGCWSVPNK